MVYIHRERQNVYTAILQGSILGKRRRADWEGVIPRDSDIDTQKKHFEDVGQLLNSADILRSHLVM